MAVTDELRREHEAILAMLKVLDKFSGGLETGRPSETEDGEEIIDFIRTFGDRCHHGKEEECLFPLLERLGVQRKGGPIGILLEEHREARALVNTMADALLRYRNGDVAAGGLFSQTSRSYIELYRAHIDKENNVIYPLADARLDAAAQQEMADLFERVEERVGAGKHEEFHRLLERMERKYLGESYMKPEYDISPKGTMPGERQGKSL